MHILITNDDGVHAPGLLCLVEAMARLGEVLVVAPLSEQSAVGHGISISQPLRVEPVKLKNGMQAFGVSGTPADCVKIAVKSLAGRKVDMVVSGINNGLNVGVNVLYSGTVAAAREGAILEIPSLAVSIGTAENPWFNSAVLWATRVVVAMMENTLPRKDILNLNVPNLPPEEIMGLKITRMGLSRFDPVMEQRMDPRKKVYYWLSGTEISHDDHPESDKEAVSGSYASLSPLTFDLTDLDFLDKLTRWTIK